MSDWQPDRSTGYDSRGHWRQVLDWKDAHLVDHSGLLWVWQFGLGGGYRPIHPIREDATIFYDLTELYD